MKLAERVQNISKNPEAETSFLPDRDRELKEEALRRQIEMEYELREQVRTSSSSNISMANLLSQLYAMPSC